MKRMLVLSAVVFLFSCSSTKKTTGSSPVISKHSISGISTDPTYGLSEKNPVQVGGARELSGPSNERWYLNSLAGPNGEAISFFRAGSCCPIKSKHGLGGVAILDNYRVTWAGSKDTVSIYINMYDSGPMQAPVGFTLKAGAVAN